MAFLGGGPVDAAVFRARGKLLSTPKTAKPLSLPVPFPNIPPFLLVVNVARETVADVLGPPMLTEWVAERGNADFWGFEYPCGLQVAIQFMHDSEGGLVLADSPEIHHVQRHIPFADTDCAPIDPETLQSQLTLLLSAYPERQSEIDSLHSFQVWRQGTDGNPFKVGSPTSKRDADCWVRHFDSLGHHQHYWCSKVGSKQLDNAMNGSTRSRDS